MPPELQEAVQLAAIPHWFDALYLEALWDVADDDLYDQLLTLSFVEQVPSKGYAIHERTRRQLLDTLWHTDPDRFRTLSGRAAAYCEPQTTQTDAPEWEAEMIYHRLISDPDVGVAGLRNLATKWANYAYHTYEEIERALRWANEQISAGRLTGAGADWTRLWQAKLALIYNRAHLDAAPLEQISTDPHRDPYLAAEVAQTRGDMLAQTGGDRAGMITAWQTAYDLYGQLPDGQGQLDASLVADKMRQQGVPAPAAATTATPPPQTDPSGNALKLIDNIAAAWIEGVLHTALEETIDLRLDRSGSQAANLVYHRGQGMDRAVGAGQRLSRLFAAAGRSLLILGAPGSGKTITLLQLLDELLQQARLDGDAPIPLLFNLSSFGAYVQEEKGALLDWLAEQAYEQYRLKRETTRERLTEKRDFVLLLDGLDEVPETDGQREQCVTAINAFMQTTLCGLVVCSRIGDYEDLKNKLAVNDALVLQPLSNPQIETFIQQVGGVQKESMRARMQTDWQLREVLRSPLLLNLYPQAFVALGAAFATGGFTVADRVETRRKALFAAYVETIFAPSAKDAPMDKGNTISKEKSVSWLSFLGNRMQKVGTSLFFIEEMQPTWLPQPLVRRYRGLYGLFNGLIGGLIFGLIVGLLLGAVMAFLDTPLVDKRPQAGMGVRASLRNSLRMTLLAALFFGLPTLFIDRTVGSDYIWLLVSLINILPPTFSWFGGLAWCQHMALRLVIAQQRWLPWRLVPWLDSMVAVGVLRRVGGGYIFLHRSLLEYFAELEAW